MSQLLKAINEAAKPHKVGRKMELLLGIGITIGVASCGYIILSIIQYLKYGGF